MFASGLAFQPLYLLAILTFIVLPVGTLNTKEGQLVFGNDFRFFSAIRRPNRKLFIFFFDCRMPELLL